ncbi:MAG: S24/S26 family peptidase [Methanobacterium sp.]
METVILWGIMAILLSTMVLIVKKSTLEVKFLKHNVQDSSNTVNIILNTDGKTITIKAASISGFLDDEEDMIKEIGMEASNDILDDKSTLESIKSNLDNIAGKYNYRAKVIINSQFGRNKLPFPATVRGTSMIPTLKDGQNIMALKTTSFKVGDIVIARHSRYGLIIKRVASINNGNMFLKSDNREIEKIKREKRLYDGTIRIETILKTPLDAWLPERDIIAVLKH